MSEPTRGARILYWPGIRHPNFPGRPGVVISDGVVKFGGTDCVRVETLEKGTDYIALTHIEVLATSATQTRVEITGNIIVHHEVKPHPIKLLEEPCDCEFVDVMGPGYPLMRMAMAHCPQHGHPWDCSGCFYCEVK